MLVWGDWESVDVPIRDAEVVNDCICWWRDGHPALEILVASINDPSTFFRW